VRDRRRLSDYSTLQGGQDWQAYSGYGPSSGSPTGVDLPDNFFGRSFSTNGFINGFSNNGGLPPQILEFNPYQVLNYLQGLGNPQTTNIPGYNRGAAPTYNGTYDAAFDTGGFERLKEESWSPFISLAQEAKIGEMPLHINMGVREEITKVTANALSQQPLALTITPGDLTALQTTLGPTSTVTAIHSYSYLLPNFDIGLDVTDKLKLRFDASRTLTRPPLNLIKPNVSVGTAQRVNALTASGGNANLNPYLSDNFDIGAEWYYARNSYFSIDGFLKKVSNFIVSGTTQRNINGVTDPSKNGALAIFSVTTSVNGPNAVVRGVELAWQQVFGNSGFGFQANATLVDTNKPFDPNNLVVGNFAVTGLANSANAVVFYDKKGFQARVAFNWRDEYLDHFGQTQTTGNYGSEPVFVNASKEVDFSTSYDINKHISVFFEALNLNDDTYSTHGRFKNQLLDVVDFGRKFTLGAHFRF
jgi:iron complex outermembrane recepter protein